MSTKNNNDSSSKKEEKPKLSLEDIKKDIDKTVESKSKSIVNKKNGKN